MYLLWRFLNEYLGEILKMPQVCTRWPCANISGLIQATQRFGMGCFAFVYLYWSLQVHRYIRGVLIVLIILRDSFIFFVSNSKAY